jgi:hypothetical protein
MKKLNVVLDIDGMLALDEGTRVREFLPADVVSLLEDSFIDVCFEYKEKKYSYLHYLLPGCFELIKAILDIPNADLIFFSHGVEPRNTNLINKIMAKITKDNNSFAAKKITLFSREHCIDTENYKRYFADNTPNWYVFQPNFYGMYGNYKKDLRLIAWGEEKYKDLCKKAFKDLQVLAPDPEKDKMILNNTILIDDDHSVVYRDQEKNLLKVPWCKSYSLYHVKKIGLDNMNELAEWTQKDSFRETNHLFYAAGLLFTALEIVNGCYEQITDVLWELQTKDFKLEVCGSHGLYGPPDYHKIAEDPAYYAKGLDILRRYNPKLDFILTDRW